MAAAMAKGWPGMSAHKAHFAGSGGVCCSLETWEAPEAESPSSDLEGRQKPSQPKVYGSCFRPEEKLLCLKVFFSISIY